MTSDRRRFIHGAGLAGLAGVAAVSSSNAQAATRGIGQDSILVASRYAPQPIKRAARYVCTGSNDQVVINRALRHLGTAGGRIQLSRGRFNVSGPVLMQPRVALIGEGRATILKAFGSWRSRDNQRTGAVIEPATQGVDTTSVSHLTINGNRLKNRADVGGIYYNITSDADFWLKPDAEHHFSDLLIMRTRQHGLHIAGSQMRGNLLSRIRVFDAGEASSESNPVESHGMFIESADNAIDQCDVGSSSGYGIFINSSNNRFSNCKSWYSDLSGWRIKQPRCSLVACESQDNAEHGFHMTTGPVSLNGCHADSNSWQREAPRGGFHGFYIQWGERIQLIGCSAYDKNEGQRGHWQAYGVFLGSAAMHCQVIMTAQDNVQGTVGGAGAGNASNMVMVAG